MDTRRSEWEGGKDLTVDQVSSMSMKNYKKILTSGRCHNKYPKDGHILNIVGVAQKIADESN